MADYSSSLKSSKFQESTSENLYQIILMEKNSTKNPFNSKNFKSNHIPHRNKSMFC